MLHLLLLGLLEGTHALEHLVPVNQGAVKLWTIDTYELCLTTNRQTTGTTHTRTIDHNGIQRNLTGNIMLLGGKIREFHHDWRTDSKHLVHMLLFNEFLDTYGNDTFLTIRAVIGHDDYLVRTLANLVLQDNQVLGTTSHHRQHTVASSFQCLNDWQHRSNAQTTTSANYRTEFLYMRGISQRTYDICDVIALVQHTQFL